MIWSASGRIATFEAGCLEARLRGARPDRLVVYSGSGRPPCLGFAEATSIQACGSASLEAIEQMESTITWQHIAEIIAIGAGSVIDTAKVLAARHGKYLVAVPTVLSCNAFATERSVLSVRGSRRTVDSHEPDKVLIDPLLLKNRPLRLHLTGIAEGLSIYTALHDWRLAVEAGAEPYDDLTFGLAESVQRYCFDMFDSIAVSASEETAYCEIVKVLAISGYLTKFYGSGRPESGSEHIFARAVEQAHTMIGHIWHGESVLLGTLLLSHIQGRPHHRIYEIAAGLGLPARLVELGFTVDKVAGLLHTASRLRPGRYTVFNRLNLSARDAHECAYDVLRMINSVSLHVSPYGSSEVMVPVE